MAAYYSSQPKHTTNHKVLIGLIVLVVLIVGSAVGLILSRTNSDTRNQAAGGGQCTPGAFLGCGGQVQCGSNQGRYCTEARVAGGCVPVQPSMCGATGGGPTITPNPTPVPTVCQPGQVVGCGRAAGCADNYGKVCNNTGTAALCVPMPASQCHPTGGTIGTPSPVPMYPSPTPIPSPITQTCSPGVVLGCGAAVMCPVNSGPMASGRVCGKNGVPGTCINVERSRCPDSMSGDYREVNR